MDAINRRLMRSGYYRSKWLNLNLLDWFEPHFGNNSTSTSSTNIFLDLLFSSLTFGHLHNQLVFSLLTLSLCGRYLERVYGTIEFIKFCLTTIGVSNFMSVVVNVVEHYVLHDSGMYLLVFITTSEYIYSKISLLTNHVYLPLLL